MSELTGLRIGRKVGGGGTATVHLATTGTGDDVAVKVFPTGACVEEVRREAAMGARFAHPHVVRVLGLDTDGPSPVLVMEWAPRGSLSELIAARGTLSPGETVTVAASLTAVLAAVRGQGLVHGDLSAANVVFSADGRPLLTDFGSARAVDDLTTAVTVTPTDLAPEVARGGSPDQAADLFSLGSVLLTCLTGRPAWAAVDLRDVLVQSTVGQWPDPGDGPLGRLIGELLDENPSRRPEPAVVLGRLRRLDPPRPLSFPPARAGRHAVPEEADPPELPGENPRPERARPDGGEPDAPVADPEPRPEWPDPREVVTQLRRQRDDDEPEPTAPSRRRLVAVSLAAAVVVLGLLAAAVLVWRGPAVADEVAPSTAPITTSSPAAQASSADRPEPPGATTAAPIPLSPPRSPASAPSSASTPGAPPVTGADPTVVTGDLAAADWTAVVTELDARRAHALVTRDEAFLDLVYVTPSPPADADARTVQDLTAADQRLAGAAHLVSEVEWQGTGADGSVRLLVTDELPPYAVLSADGTKVGTTAARGPTVQEMVLSPTQQGFRIASVGPV